MRFCRFAGLRYRAAASHSRLPAAPAAATAVGGSTRAPLLPPQPEPCQADASCIAALVCFGFTAAVGVSYRRRQLASRESGPSPIRESEPSPVDAEEAVVVSNWSGTHSAKTDRFFTPESQEELEELVRWADRDGQKIRPVGTALSPNGVALDPRGMVSMAQLDGIVSVDTERQTVTVKAGTRVSVILEELRKHGLTLENFSSITEQQIGGWTQTSAHGTGARIPTVDEMITDMVLVTPGKGTLKLSASGPDDSLFRWARVGLGLLGIVTEVTLKCIPSYRLHERTYCTTEAELRKNHAKLLQTYRHVRYMWVPYTDTVVVVVSDIPETGAKAEPGLPTEERIKPFHDLLRQLNPKCGSLDGLSFADVRERLLVLDPLNPAHVARVNQAEAEFWKRSTGERIAESTEILGFECGSVQWVLENCFPCGTIDKPSLRDLDYVAEMKRLIEIEGIAAASPIEQRWTSRSTSPLSPAFSKTPEDIFSWVGIIMYITDEAKAASIKGKFREYAMHHADLTFDYGGVFHWAKLDLDFHKGEHRLEQLRRNLKERFDVSGFLKVRKELDPNNILGNRLTDESLQE